MTPKKHAATVLAQTIGWCAIDVREYQYQPSRYSSPAVFAIGDTYLAVHSTKPSHDLGEGWHEHADKFWTNGTQRKVWVSKFTGGE